MNLPNELKDIIGQRDFFEDSIGKSDSTVLCFDDVVLKIEDKNSESDNEHEMLEWLSDKLSVPEILYSKCIDGINYLLMSKLNGRMSCNKDFLENPNLLVKILAQGLKMLWSVDITDCPSNCMLDNKLKAAEERVLANLCDMEDSELGTFGENAFASPSHLLSWLKDNKPRETPVLSHGDYCLPNIFINDNKISGFIDLGRCGAADKYQDIALCCRSLNSNFNGRFSGKAYPGFSIDMLFDELEITPDWDLINYYILLDELF